MARQRVGGRIGATVLALGLLTTTGYVAAAALAPLDPIAAELVATPVVETPEATVSLPSYGASAIGDADSEHIYAAVGLDESRPIASVTKVVTALVVLEAHPIADGHDGAAIPLTQDDARLVSQYAAINGTTAPVRVGSTISQRSVIELMIVHSANNYAETLAVWAFGSVEAYLAAAREWLDAKGLDAIRIADTTGFSPDNTGTPRALLRLARLAIAEPVIAAAARLPQVTAVGVGTFANRNLILGVDGVTGLKTGTLRASGASLLFSADHDGPESVQRLVGVVLNGPDHPRVAADVRSLLSSVRDDYHEITIVEAGTVFARYESPWGDVVELQAAETIEGVVWGTVRSTVVVRAPALQPGVGPRDEPSVIVRYGNRRDYVAVRWVGTMGEPPLEWRLRQPIESVVGG